MYKLIGSLKTRGIRVLWLLEELGAEYEVDPVAPRSEEARAINPSGKVPMLQDGDDIIIDSVAICQYLADKHGKFTYAAGTIERAHQDSWTNFAIDELDSALWFMAKNTFILPEELRSKTAIEACKYEFYRGIEFFEKRLGDNTYVMGDEFTVPDLLIGHLAGWAMNMPKWEIPAGPVADYVQRVRSRPACVRALEIRDRS